MHTGKISNKISKRSRQREQLISALLQEPSLAKAAASISMSTTTAWRISKTPEFQAEDREARRDDAQQLLGRLQRGSGTAVSTLLTGLVDKTASDAALVRAAHGVLEQAGKGHGMGVPGGPRRPQGAAPDAPSPKHVTWEEFRQQYIGLTFEIAGKATCRIL